MARMHADERIARKFIDAIGGIDFNPRAAAYFFTRAGYLYQFAMWELIKNLMEQWAKDLDKGEDKGSTKYLRQTINAAQILDLMTQQEDLEGYEGD